MIEIEVQDEVCRVCDGGGGYFQSRDVARKVFYLTGKTMKPTRSPTLKGTALDENGSDKNHDDAKFNY